MRSGRHMRGASAVMSVLLLLMFSASVLAAWHVDEDFERRRMLDAESGRVFAMWLGVAHRATMRNDYRPALAADPDGFAVSPSALPGAPSGLRAPPELTVGVISDGNGVPMAWAVLDVGPDARAEARSGAFSAGLADVAVAGGGGAMAVHEAAVAAARGTPIPAGALFATADLAIAYDEDVLYRREQPGRPWANRMEGALALGGNDIAAGGAADGIAAAASGDVEAGGAADIEGDATGANLTAARLGAAELVGASLAAANRIEAGSARTAAGLEAGSVNAQTRLAAGSLETLGPVDADLMVIGGALALTNVPGVSPAGAGSLTSGAGLAARDVRVTGDLDAPSTSVTGPLAAGSLTADGATGNSMSVSGSVFGPSARISGTMTVGSCDGCRY